ncbi:precorrin-3B C(17)-methyltransferase [Prochlorothrix hollandica]|uniref:precorrin-3B C(17)-methyltransferase n=1 Tax=Prochlorothrix hollandica TaxID=1223 RepID=UPI00037781E2|nr:precorrin-3B C(17)-methyltransferase [Prochlorothrix hollandica]
MYCPYSDILIRDWRPSDRPQAAHLVAQVLGEYGLSWDPEGVDRDIVQVETAYWDRGGELWVLEQGGTLVGTGGYYPVSHPQTGPGEPAPGEPKTAVELRKFFLLPQVRGQGLGWRLLHHLEAAIAARGFRQIWVETVTVLTEATRLYSRNGYDRRQDLNPAISRCDLVFHKTLTPTPRPSLGQGFSSLAAVTTTDSGCQRLAGLCQDFQIPLYTSAAVAQAWGDRTPIAPHLIQVYGSSLRDTLGDRWHRHQGFVFCLAAGAVVRLIAPLLGDKATDPAIVVVDEPGQFVISLCSGHQGQADHLAQQVARILGATPVLTGSATAQDFVGVDQIGVPFGWQRGAGDWTAVSGAVARREPVQVIQRDGSPLWQAHLPLQSSLQVVNAPGTRGNPGETTPPGTATIWITAESDPPPTAPQPQVIWHPRTLWVGIGCERGTAAALIEEAIAQTCADHHWAMGAIAGVATVDLKADEAGLLAVCQQRGWTLRCFSPGQLQGIPVPTPSAVVEREVGTPSVAEAAARCAAGYQPEDPHSGPLLVAKQIHRQPGITGAVTVAIAQAPQEYTGRSGALSLVGTGPGALSQMTPAAQAAITAADVVIGYSLYVDLVRPLVRPGQIIEALPITQERARAERAIELAHWGLTVAVISSGDSGIYGMAGLVLECLSRQGWDGQTPSVQVFPGITALQSAAAQVGTPLMHDFCAISLSDLLTPWPVIKTRLQAAAQADFVVALYNPQSKTRTEPLAQAQAIFLDHRDASTPVALVRSAYRPDQTITLTTLGDFLEQGVDMLTTVLIGNQSTYRHGDWLITPRGYLGGV